MNLLWLLFVPRRFRESTLGTDLPSAGPDWKLVTKFQFVYSMVGQVLGVIVVVMGVFLFGLGISGNTNWNLTIGPLASNMSNAAPGALLFAAGLAIVWITRFTVTLVPRGTG